MTRTKVAVALLACLLAGGAPAHAPAQDVTAAPAQTSLPEGWTASNMRPVAYIRVGDGTRPFKLGLKTSAKRLYLFVGEGGSGATQTTGFRAIDVTDPAAPKVGPHVKVPTGDGQITLHGNLLIAGRQLPFPPPSAGGSIEYPYKGASAVPTAMASLYDITDPLRPRKLSDWVAKGWGTHRNGYPGGRHAFMSAWVEGYRGQSVLVLLDVSDPAHPRETGRWWMPGQHEDEVERVPPPGFHGPPILSRDGKMLTLGYTPAVVNLDISDPAHPRLIGRLDLSPLAPVGTQAIHSVVSLGGTLLHVSTEPSAAGCNKESAAFAAIVDNADPARPRLLSYYPRPRPALGSGLANFCDKEGRFGPHNVVTELHQDAVAQTAPLVFMTYFNAGLRVFDVSDPHTPAEVGWFLPRIGAWSAGRRGLEDVIADRRGYIYASDGRDGGIWILRYTGPVKGT